MEKLRALARNSATRRYEIIAFITGFALMAYELSASRILAPHIGSSTYVWTSVIGVIIAALSAGYAMGGILADRRVTASDLAWLLLASAGGMASTLIMSDDVLQFIVSFVDDPRLQGLLASALLFLPASLALGMISPYLARLRNVSLSTTGRAVASLSALNSIGGILGTFCVGFIFFGYLGSKQTLFCIIFLLCITSWLVRPRILVKPRLIATIAILTAGNLPLMTPMNNLALAEIDTPTAHYQVIEALYKKESVRMLLTGPAGGQSGVNPLHPDELIFNYLKQTAAIIEQRPHKQRILVLGGGAFTLPQHLAVYYPESQIDVAEIDPKLVGIAKKYFSYRDHPNVRIISEDARAYVNRDHQPYDIIVVDIFNELSIPFPVTTNSYAARLKQNLQPDGLVVTNLVASTEPRCAALLGSLNTTYRQSFAYSRVWPLPSNGNSGLQNILLLYSNQSLDALHYSGKELTNPPAGRILTDNFAPLERMQQQCRPLRQS